MIDQSSSLLSTVPPFVLDAIFWIAAVSCVVAQFFILRAVWRVVPSITGSPNVPAPRRAPEVFWALLPTLLLIALFIGAWRVRHPSSPAIVNPAVTPTTTRATTSSTLATPRV